MESGTGQNSIPLTANDLTCNDLSCIRATRTVPRLTANMHVNSSHSQRFNMHHLFSILNLVIGFYHYLLSNSNQISAISRLFVAVMLE